MVYQVAEGPQPVKRAFPRRGLAGEPLQIGKNVAFSGSKTIIILAMFAKNRKIPALNLALRN